MGKFFLELLFGLFVPLADLRNFVGQHLPKLAAQDADQFFF